MQEMMISADMPMTKEEIVSLDKLMFGGYKTFIEKMMNAFKEELIYLHGRIDQVELNQHESNMAMTNGLKLIANGQTDIAKALREQTASDKEIADKQCKWSFAIANKDKSKEETNSDTNPLFGCCSKSLPEQRNWVNIVKGQIALAVDKTKIPEGSIYSHLYAGMKSHDGYDVDQLWRTYGKSKYATKLDMFAASDMLRLSFEKGVYRFYLSKGIMSSDNVLVSVMTEETQINKETGKVNASPIKHRGKQPKGVYSTDISKRTPDEIRKAISPKYGDKPQNLRKAYRDFEKASGVDLNQLVEETKNQFCLTTCSTGFAISLDPKVKRQFLRSMKSVA